ncbi:MAG TPA: hypothetical protein VK427_23015 [Kofleriaceae bacterium]|nr:hypothetical protein [Kofleriaceae bacterium]
MKPLVVASILAGLASPALAEPGDPVFDPMSLRRQTPLSTFSFDFGFEVWDDPAGTDTSVYTINVAGQFVNDRGLGAYFTLPLTYLSFETPLIDDSDMALGNIEVGGIFTKYFGRTALVMNAGLGLPTASDDGVSSLQIVGAFTRLTDLPLRVTSSTWLRLGVSPMGRAGSFLWRIDAGLDLALDEDNVDQLSPIFHLNVGAGVDLGGAQLLGELVNVFSDSNGDDDASTFSFGARFSSGNLRPGIALLLPIDLDSADTFEWALLASLAVRTPSL